MKAFLTKHYWWLIALALALALMPRGVVSEAELNRRNAQGDDTAKWTEYLVYKLAAARMRAGESMNRVDLKGSLHEHLLGPEGLAREREEWRASYQELLKITIADSNVYRLHEHAYAYPPLWGLLSVPLDSLGWYDLEAVLWHLLVMAGLIVGARIAFLLVFKGRGNSPPIGVELPTKWWRWFATPRGIGISVTFVASAYLLGPVSNQQNDSMVFALVMLGAFTLSRDKPWLAGLCFGLAAVSKGPLLILLPWLCFKRRWSAALSTLLAGAFFTLLPDLLFPSESGQLYIVDWYEISLKPLLSSGEAAASSTAWFRFNNLNQSLGATLDRLFGMGRGANIEPALFEIADHTRKLLTYGLYLLLLVAGVAIWRQGRVTPASILSPRPMPFVAGPDEPASRGLVLELSTVMILACLLSPMTSPPHLCFMVAPLFLIADAMWQRRRLMLIFFACALPMLIVNKDIIGKHPVEWMRFYGLAVWIMLLVLMGLAMIARQSRRSLSDRLASAKEPA